MIRFILVLSILILFASDSFAQNCANGRCTFAPQASYSPQVSYKPAAQAPQSTAQPKQGFFAKIQERRAERRAARGCH